MVWQRNGLVRVGASLEIAFIHVVISPYLASVYSCCHITVSRIHNYFMHTLTFTSYNYRIILGFAVVTPMTSSLAMAFRRREQALVEISRVRSFSFQIYLAHALWDSEKGGRTASTDTNWLEHCDFVMAQLIGIGDELSRFLSLPSSSRSRHRMTRSGRREAARTVKAAYLLFESLYTQRMMRLTAYDERLRHAGVSASEISRIRQYERFIGEAMERLRMFKMYRTPQALRSFARIFTLILPAFYAPTFAQLARDVQSLGMGISFGLLIAVGLSGLFNAIQCLEDPFVGFLTLDGINVAEEFQVLQWQQLVNARDVLFPYSSDFPMGTRTALRSGTPLPELAKALPTKSRHERGVSWGGDDLIGDLRNDEDDPMMRDRLDTEGTVPLADIRISEFAQYLPDNELEVAQEEGDVPAAPQEPGSPTPGHRRTPSRAKPFTLSSSNRRRRNLGESFRGLHSNQ